MKKHNFNPACGPPGQEVLQEASQAIIEYRNTGLSLLEISHRGSDFESIIAEAISLTKEILGLSDDYHVIFTMGGASTQFYMMAMNL